MKECFFTDSSSKLYETKNKQGLKDIPPAVYTDEWTTIPHSHKVLQLNTVHIKLTLVVLQNGLFKSQVN